MKKILVCLICSMICISLISCNQTETVDDSSYSQNAVSGEPIHSQSPVESSEIFAMVSPVIYKSFDEFFAYNPTGYGKALNLSRISSCVEVSSIFTNSNRYSISNSVGVITIFPLCIEKNAACDPWQFPTIDQAHQHTPAIFNDADEFTNHYTEAIYKYTKEEVDIYLVESDGGDHYTLSFIIGDYGFDIYSTAHHLKSDRSFLTPDEYAKLRPQYEGNMGLYELNDISHQNSELIRILKEIIAEANGTVTE